MISNAIRRDLEREKVVLRKRLGEGAFAFVYECLYDDHVPGAIKISKRPLNDKHLNDEHLCEVRKERDRLKALMDLKLLPNMTRLRRFLSPQKHLATIWDLGEKDLQDRLAECQAKGQRGIPSEELLRYMGEIAHALDYLHGKSFYHRDVKPRNIVLIEGSAHLADLGHAIYAGLSHDGHSLAGTIDYMAPEVLRERKYSPVSDLYALAVTYLALRTGYPVPGGKEKALKDLREPERGAVATALAESPEQRPRRVIDWVKALEKAADPPARHLCSLCNKPFVSTSAMEQHHLDKHGHPCTIGDCGRRFATKNNLENHVIEVHHWRLCLRCEISFPSPAALEEHRKSCAGGIPRHRPPQNGVKGSR